MAIAEARLTSFNPLIYLNNYASTSVLQDAISRIQSEPSTDSQIDFNLAINGTLNTLLTTARGRRSGVPAVVVWLVADRL